MKNVRSSQSCISMNFILNSVKNKFFHVTIVNDRDDTRAVVPPITVRKALAVKSVSCKSMCLESNLRALNPLFVIALEKWTECTTTIFF